MPAPLQGIKVLDFTGVQSGPSCTQMLTWFGADVIKIGRPSVGDVAHHQLRDVPDIDASHFTMLNSNRRSIELDAKTVEGKEVMEKLIREADILVGNFHPGAIDYTGFTWKRIQEINPRLIFNSIKGSDGCSPCVNVKAYKNVAQAAGGAASTTDFWDGSPLISAAALNDSNTGIHLPIGLLAALLHHEKTGHGQRVIMSIQDAVLSLCRMKLRSQQHLDKLGYLEKYPQCPNDIFGDTVPRGGNAGGDGQSGWIPKCKSWKTDPDAYIYPTIREQNWENTCKTIGKPERITDPTYNTAHARQPHIFDIFAETERYTVTVGKHEAVAYLAQFDIPYAPVLNMKEISLDPSLRQGGSVVEVEQPLCGRCLIVGHPMKFFAFTPDIRAAPLLGEYTATVLQELGYSDDEITAMKRNHAIWY